MVQILTATERLKLVKKRDDEVAFQLYDQGLSDGKIAQVFSMRRNGIYSWRKKNGLVANNERPDKSPNLTEEELKEKAKEDARKIQSLGYANYKRNIEKRREYKRKCSRLQRYREKHFQWIKDNPERWRELNKKYEEQPRVKKMRKEYNKEYWQRPEVKEKDKGRRRRFAKSKESEDATK